MVHSFLCMFLGMAKLWANIALEPNVPYTQISEYEALNKAKTL